jgi:hypothetical protein
MINEGTEEATSNNNASKTSGQLLERASIYRWRALLHVICMYIIRPVYYYLFLSLYLVASLSKLSWKLVSSELQREEELSIHTSLN